ncbi:MAG: scpB [Candidatus Taylorbacteria bacterium]|nr:scpB [Candidatus Taylorbacteria bacterium]
METEKLEQLIEAILFWKGEPVNIKKLADLCKVTEEEISSSVVRLESLLQNRGIVLIRNDNEVMLGTHPFAAKIIEDLTREELSKELSKATLETLSIIIYMSPIRRSEIDYIRGVNSQFSIRHLEMRGLIQKVASESDSRVYLYSPTLEALSFLGVSNISEIPGFADTKVKLESFKEQKEEVVSENKIEEELE